MKSAISSQRTTGYVRNFTLCFLNRNYLIQNMQIFFLLLSVHGSWGQTLPAQISKGLLLLLSNSIHSELHSLLCANMDWCSWVPLSYISENSTSNFGYLVLWFVLQECKLLDRLSTKLCTIYIPIYITNVHIVGRSCIYVYSLMYVYPLFYMYTSLFAQRTVLFSIATVWSISHQWVGYGLSPESSFNVILPRWQMTQNRNWVISFWNHL